ncbi:hypothetical protein BH23GEM10_BH23GEM10_09720 [soil metagenome]
MTAHPEAYRQFTEPGIPEQIREIELELSGRKRHYVVQRGLSRSRQTSTCGSPTAFS